MQLDVVGENGAFTTSTILLAIWFLTIVSYSHRISGSF